jgi:hypothetical protein
MDESENSNVAYLVFSWVFFVIVSAKLVVGIPYHLSDSGSSMAIYIASSTILGLLFAIAFSGYLLRLFPLQALGSPAAAYLWSFVACSVSGMIFPFAAWVWEGKWRLGLQNGLFLWFAWFLYLWWNTARERNLRRPFVLFLRRFGSFADLSVMLSVLRKAPCGYPVVMLVGENDPDVGVWDPISLVSFGFRAIIPLAGRPLFLNGGKRWKEVFESLAYRSAAVVLDATDLEESEHLRWELQSIAQCKSAVSVILLFNEEVETRHPPLIPQGLKNRAITIQYGRGRLFLARGLGFTVATVAIVGYRVDILQQLSDAAAQGKLAGAIFGAFVMLGGLSLFLLFLTLRRGLSQRSRRDIADAFHAALPLTIVRK